MKRYSTIITALFAILILVQACKKDKANPSGDSTDADLYNMISLNGYTYYAGTPGITAALGDSPHGFERVRFNAVAQAALDSTGKLPVGGSFPSGSVIVKEVYSSATGGHFAYAVMKKDPDHINSASGYLWAEFNIDGSVAYSISNKGASCVSCHSGPGNRDLVRSFDLH